MASSFPGSIDSFTNPLAASALNSPSHAGQHQDLNDAVNKVETYMGLVKVIPTVSSTGGTAATVSATGTISINSGNTTVTVTCFTSLYQSYRIVFSACTNSGNGNNIYLKLNNTSGSTYSFSGPYQTHSSAALTGATASATSVGMLVGFTNTTTWSTSMDIYNANNAAPTTFIAQHTGGLLSGHFMGVDTNAAASTAFTINTTSFTFDSGTIRVYGYRN